MSLNFNCSGVLRKKQNGNFEFVVRWFIHDDESGAVTYLPSPKGKFYLTIRTKNTNEYLNADGKITPVPVGDLNRPVIMPLNYLMVSPPQNYTPPTEPIDPDDQEGKKGIGVYHLLAESRVSRYSNKIAQTTKEVIKRRQSFFLEKFSANTSIESYSQKLSRYIVGKRIKPRNLQAIFVKEYSSLQKFTLTPKSKMYAKDIPDLFKFHTEKNNNFDSVAPEKLSEILQEAWQHASFLSELFKDTSYLKTINSYVQSSENIKSQMAMLGLQCAEIIDYWCNPFISQPNRVENDCGKKYNSSEAVGLGKTIGDISLATIEQWRLSDESILISAEYIPPTKNDLLQSAEYNWKDLHDNNFLDDIPPMVSTVSLITSTGTNSLENIVNYNSSCPPSEPKSASVEYDLFLKRLKPDLGEEVNLKKQIGFNEYIEIATGDGRAQFKILKPDGKLFPHLVNPENGNIISEEISSVVNGINIYGMWEPEDNGSPYKIYFEDVTKNPPLSELKPWLITRRYSFNKDFKPYFDPLNINLKLNQQNPPISPAFQNVGKNSNLEKILGFNKDGDVINELLPVRETNDPDNQVVPFSFNVREGFKNKYSNDIPLTWDKFPLQSTETEWQPSLWKSGVHKTTPQRYRFWATSVDLYGQESAPIPITNKETSASQQLNTIHFKYRSSLQPPPSNKGNQKDAITITHADNKLKIKWESPANGMLGNQVDNQHPIPDSRIAKDALFANLLYLRKPHNPQAKDIPDDKLEAYIKLLQSSLPAVFKNEKWKIGLTEILKHNSNWKPHKWFENFLDNSAGNNWNHSLDITEIDKGFDYIVLINFTIKQDQRQFWTNDENLRRLHVGEQQETIVTSHYIYTTKEIQEAPSVSNIAFTESVLISNQNLPRLVTSTENFISAKPILGIQGINRDLVLSNILTTPNRIEVVETENNGQKENANAVVFVSDGSELLCTDGQKCMIDAAMHRCKSSEADLSIPQQLLKKEVTNLNKKIFPEKKATNGNTYLFFTKESNKNVVSNDLIGFRGLKKFRVRYNSVYSAFQQFQSESEALKFEIYQTRIQLRESLNFNESFAAVSFVSENTLKYKDVTFEDGVKPDGYKVPIFLTLRFDKGYSIHQLTSISKSANGKYSIELSNPLVEESDLKIPVKISFIVSNLLLEKEIEMDEKLFYEEDILLPVGGGFREIFIWSISTTSALGKISGQLINFHQVFQSSMLPPGLQEFKVSPISTQEEKQEYYLDSQQHKNWLPQKLQNSDQSALQRNPRIHIKWLQDKSLPSDIYLAVEREFREEEIKGLFKAKSRNDWELASKIEKLELNEGDNPHGLIFIEWLSQFNNPSLFNWLFESSVVDVPGEMGIRLTDVHQLVGPESELFDPKSQLRAVTGLINDNLDPLKTKVIFVDYFYDNKVLDSGMDTFRSYNYRLSTYIDIDPNGDFGITDPKQKYLYSKPTAWSGWIRPTFPKISLKKLSTENHEWKQELYPQLQIMFVFKDELMALKEFTASRPLFYRVIVKKEILNSISTHEQKPTGSLFMESGEIINIPVLPEVGRPYFILDNNIEREDITTEVVLNYRVEVSVVATTSDDKVYFIRKEQILDLKGIKIPPVSANKECKKTIFIKIE